LNKSYETHFILKFESQTNIVTKKREQNRKVIIILNVSKPKILLLSRKNHFFIVNDIFDFSTLNSLNILRLHCFVPFWLLLFLLVNFFQYFVWSFHVLLLDQMGKKTKKIGCKTRWKVMKCVWQDVCVGG
jgi:hypothetical protein